MLPQFLLIGLMLNLMLFPPVLNWYHVYSESWHIPETGSMFLGSCFFYPIFDQILLNATIHKMQMQGFIIKHFSVWDTI